MYQHLETIHEKCLGFSIRFLSVIVTRFIELVGVFLHSMLENFL